MHHQVYHLDMQESFDLQVTYCIRMEQLSAIVW